MSVCFMPATLKECKRIHIVYKWEDNRQIYEYDGKVVGYTVTDVTITIMTKVSSSNKHKLLSLPHAFATISPIVSDATHKFPLKIPPILHNHN